LYEILVYYPEINHFQSQDAIFILRRCRFSRENHLLAWSRLSAFISSVSTGRIFVKFDTWGTLYENPSSNSKISLRKITTTSGTAWRFNDAYWFLFYYFLQWTNKCTIISQIITLVRVSTLSCHPQGAHSQYLAKSHKYVNFSCW